MKKSDVIAICCVVAVIILFSCSSYARKFFSLANSRHGYLMSFAKFAFLGIMLGLILAIAGSRKKD